MKSPTLKAGKIAGSYIIDSPVTEADILQLALQLAARRLARGNR